MSQFSPPVARAVSVLNFLAEHAEQAFTLSEIVKSLRISSATCHTLLTALSDAGYVYRTVGKTYVLGPALARVSQAALAPGVIMQVARPEMRQLADEFNIVCSACFLVGEQIIVRERASAVSHLNWHKQPLHALPATGLFQGMYLSGDKAALAAWLAAERSAAGEDEVTRIEEWVSFLEERGFTFGVRKVPLVNPDQARELQNQAGLTDYALSQLEAKQDYDLAYVAAPVYSRPGAVAFVLGLTGFIRPTPGEQIEAMGQRLRAACDRVGAFISGRELS